MSNYAPFGDNENRTRNVSLFAAGITSNSGNPRQETFGSFLKNFCCPQYKFKSFIMAITIIDIIIYIVTLSYDGIADVRNFGLLAPTYKALDFFGMSVKLN